MKLLADEAEGLGRPTAACLENFRSEPLEKIGFLEALRQGALVSEGFGLVRGRLCLPAGLFSVLESTFCAPAAASRAAEHKRLSSQILRAEEVLSAERAAAGDRLRLCRTLTAASAMGLVILLL